jgi:FMN phosphatase YigB (HAD superfamily)
MCALFLFFAPCIAEADKKIVVAWDIHGVLCSQPKWHGYNCVPNQQTFELVKKLHEKGVKQVLFSNISESSRKKLIERYPELFSYFDLSKSMAKAEGIFTRKPHSKYIEKFLEKVWPMNATNIVFFDDKKDNVRAAREYCIDAHVFQNADQATEILKQRQIL